MKVLFDIPLGRIAIEGDGPELVKILEAARELAPHVSQIQITRGDTDAFKSADEATQTPRSAGASATLQTMRQFARSLSIDNAAERIAALAYYANKIEKKPSFTPREMDGWFTQCGFQKPSQMSVALYDTKRKYGYTENSERGSWKISNQGENLIIRKIEDRDQGTTGT